MKQLMTLLAILLTAAFFSQACTKKIFPSGPSSPTATPTVSCGFTPVPNPVVADPELDFVTPGTYTVQNATEWASINGSDPVPSVNFANQMILEYTSKTSVDCTGFYTAPTITSVCFYSDHIEVTGTRPYSTPGTPLPFPAVCNSIFFLPGKVLVSVNQSTLPVQWNMQ